MDKYDIKIDGVKRSLSELYSMRNRLREKLFKLDPIEELMTYNLILSSRKYEMLGLKNQILQQKYALEKHDSKEFDIRHKAIEKVIGVLEKDQRLISNKREVKKILDRIINCFASSATSTTGVWGYDTEIYPTQEDARQSIINAISRIK